MIAAKHPKWGERPVAIVVLKQGASVTAGELRTFLELGQLPGLARSMRSIRQLHLILAY